MNTIKAAQVEEEGYFTHPEPCIYMVVKFDAPAVLGRVVPHPTGGWVRLGNAYILALDGPQHAVEVYARSQAQAAQCGLSVEGYEMGNNQPVARYRVNFTA
jgi:hypothetical protein